MESYTSQDLFIKQKFKYLEKKNLNAENWLCR